jgi:hypothetical protein
MKKNLAIDYLPYAIFTLGVSVCLVGVLIVVAGGGVFGESHTGIAALVGIVGIGIMGSTAPMFFWTKARRRGT